MQMKRFHWYLGSAGISLVELLIVVALISLLAAGTVPVLTNLVFWTRQDVSGELVLAQVRKAQTNAMTGKATGDWGVCVDGQVIRVFTGSCGSPVESQEVTLDAVVSVTGLGGSTFNVRGEPDTATTITISSPNENSTITLNAAGGIDVSW